MPERIVTAPVPIDIFPLSVKLPVPAVPAVLEARRSSAPVAPVVRVRSAFNVRSRIAYNVMLLAPVVLMSRSMIKSKNPVMLTAPKAAPWRTRLVASAVQLGRVPLIPEINVSAPVPTESGLPFKVRLPVPAVEPPAACKLNAPAAPVTRLRPALIIKSR